MHALKKLLLGGCVAALMVGTSHSALAQRGGFDPAQIKQYRLERAHDALGMTNETEWTAIEPLVGKVIDAQTDLFRMRMGGGMGRGGRRNREGGEEGSTNNRPRRGFGGEQSPAVAALQAAIESKAPASELKAKLAALRAEVKQKEAALDAAEADLKGVLTTRQEAILVTNGILR